MKTTTSFTQPAYGDTADVTVSGVAGLAEGQVVCIPAAGYYLVVSVSLGTEQCRVRTLVPVAEPGATVPARSAVVPSGVPPVSSLPTVTVLRGTAANPYHTSRLHEIVLVDSNAAAWTVSADVADAGATLVVSDFQGNANHNAITVTGAQFFSPVGGASPGATYVISAAYGIARFVCGGQQPAYVVSAQASYFAY